METNLKFNQASESNAVTGASAVEAVKDSVSSTSVVSNGKLAPEIVSDILSRADALRVEKKLKRIYPIVVVGEECDEKPLYVGYFKRPDFVTFSMFMNKVTQDSVQASKMLAQNCFVEGDKELYSDDDLFLFGLMNQLTVLVGDRHAELVKR